jgi:predicted ATP-grasp superfamily ATP-dependent carboligase
VEFLVAAGRGLECRPVLFAAGDPHLELLSAGREALAASYEFAIPERAILEILRDKCAQYRWLMDRNVPVPRTCVPRSAEEAAHDAAQVGLPCIAKPGISHLWTRTASSKVVLLKSAGDARAAFTAMEAAGSGCLIQAIVGGGDDHFYGALCCFSRHGAPLAAFTKRKLRQYPERFGNGSVQLSVAAPQLAERSVAMLRGLEARGFMSIEYKLDPADGEMKLIEINPRSVSGLQLAVDSGCDLPWIGYCDLSGLPADAAGGHREGVLFVNEAWEMRRVRAARRALAWPGYLATLLWARSRAALSLEDPGPAWSLFKRAAGL